MCRIRHFIKNLKNFIYPNNFFILSLLRQKTNTSIKSSISLSIAVLFKKYQIYNHLAILRFVFIYMSQKSLSLIIFTILYFNTVYGFIAKKNTNKNKNNYCLP